MSEPRVRAAAPVLLGALVGGMIAGRFETGLACLGAALAGGVAVRAGWPRRGLWLALLVGVTVALGANLWLTPGQALPWGAIAGHAPTREGLRFGLLLGLRLVTAGVALHGLRAAWPGERAADELAGRLAPLERIGVPVAGMRLVLGLALRFAPMLAEESGRIARLQSLRAGRPPRGLRERLVRRRAVAVPLIVHALERAERVALALEARHYRLRRPPPRVARGWAWEGAGAALASAALLWRGR